jgi:hypothetical protein
MHDLKIEYCRLKIAAHPPGGALPARHQNFQFSIFDLQSNSAKR